jgi:hypothetical protein
VGHVARLVGMKNAYCILIEKSERKKPLCRPRRPGRIILKWMNLARDRLQYHEYGSELSGSIKGEEWGRAQAVSRRLPTAAARIRSQVRSCGICGGQSGTGAGFLRVLQLPLLVSCHQLFYVH